MRKDILLPALAIAGGGAGFALRCWQLASAFDGETQLFRPGSAATLALLGVLAALAVLLAVLVRGGKIAASYSQVFFCPSAGYMTLMAAGSFLMLAAAALGILEGLWQLRLWREELGVPLPAMLLVTAVLCVPGGVAGLMLGRGNYRGTLPEAYPLLTTLPVYAVLPWVVGLYQDNSRQPELMLFVITLAAAVSTALGLYGAASFAFERPRPRMCLYFSLMGVTLLLTCLADRPSRFFVVMDLACVLLLLAQSYALLRAVFGPPWPEAQQDGRMPQAGGEEEREN